MTPEEAKELIDKLSSYGADLDNTIESKRGVIDNLDDQIANRRRELTKLDEELDVARTDTIEETRILEDNTATIKAENDRIKQENADLVRRKGELQTANSQLEQSNKEFIEYEKKAWISLKAKDEELQGREKAVAEKENYSPRHNSFLPPTE